jgi:type II secretory pathway component PulJ
MNRRRGTSLVELLVVINASVLVLGLIAGTIQSLARTSRASERHLVDGNRLVRCCESFRRAAWAASAAECTADNRMITLEFDANRAVEFRAIGNSVVETERHGGNPVRQQHYVLPNQCQIQFSVRSGDGQAVASASIEKRSGRRRTMQIQANIGRDRRFLDEHE